MTSINGRFSYPGLTVYCATKFGLEGFSDALRYELSKHNVNVVIIEPGDFSKVTNIMDVSIYNYSITKVECRLGHRYPVYRTQGNVSEKCQTF